MLSWGPANEDQPSGSNGAAGAVGMPTAAQAVCSGQQVHGKTTTHVTDELAQVVVSEFDRFLVFPFKRNSGRISMAELPRCRVRQSPRFVERSMAGKR